MRRHSLELLFVPLVSVSTKAVATEGFDCTVKLFCCLLAMISVFTSSVLVRHSYLSCAVCASASMCTSMESTSISWSRLYRVCRFVGWSCGTSGILSDWSLFNCCPTAVPLVSVCIFSDITPSKQLSFVLFLLSAYPFTCLLLSVNVILSLFFVVGDWPCAHRFGYWV